jgi:hypothetical protein
MDASLLHHRAVSENVTSIYMPVIFRDYKGFLHTSSEVLLLLTHIKTDS